VHITGQLDVIKKFSSGPLGWSADGPGLDDVRVEGEAVDDRGG